MPNGLCVCVCVCVRGMVCRPTRRFLRSPSVHNIDLKPFGLRDYGRAHHWGDPGCFAEPCVTQSRTTPSAGDTPRVH